MAGAQRALLTKIGAVNVELHSGLVYVLNHKANNAVKAYKPSKLHYLTGSRTRIRFGKRAKHTHVHLTCQYASHMSDPHIKSL